MAVTDKSNDIAPETTGGSDSRPPEGSSFSALMRVFTFGNRTYHGLLAFGTVGAIASGVSLAMVNIVLGNFMNLLSDITLGSSDYDGYMAAVSRTALYFVYIGIVRLAGTYIYSSAFTYVASRLVRNMQQKYLRAALAQETGYHDSGVSGSIAVQATSNGRSIQSGIGEKLGLVIHSIATFVAAFIIAFITQWKLTLITMCMIPALFLSTGIPAALDSAINVEMSKLQGQAGAYVESVLASLHTVHAYNLRPRVMSKYGSYMQNVLSHGMKKNKFTGIMFGGQFFIMSAGMGLAFWQGFAMMERGEISDLGTVFTVLFSVVIAASALMKMAPNIATFSQAAVSATQLLQLIDRETIIDAFDSSGQTPDSSEGRIDISGVSFNYPMRPDVTVLDDFTLSIPSGKVTALVGPSGSGKSTIIGLMERWYDPRSGSIALDGVDIRELNLRWLRTNVRLVQQEPVLFRGTVLENIANGLVATPWEHEPQEAQMNRVQRACELAFAHDFIMALPQGYDTNIGERGGLLSGGQKQRLAIARSVVSEPKILLLDEATSALDPHAESVVQKALDRASAGRTTIVIAHKLATIRAADNIAVISGGRLAEQGTHGELVSAGGLYSRLVTAQSLSPDLTRKSAHGTANEDEPTDAEQAEDQSYLIEKPRTLEEHQISSPTVSEDFDTFEQVGLVHSILKLFFSNPQLLPWYILSLLVCIGGGVMYPAQALILGNIVELIGPERNSSDANFMALMFLVVAIGSLAVYFGMGWSANFIAQTLNVGLRRDILDSYLRQDVRFFDRPENTVGALNSRLDAHSVAILEMMGINISLVLVSVLGVVASSILAFAVAWRVAVVAVFAGAPPLLFAGWIRIRLDAKMERDMSNAFSQSASIASEAVLAIRTVSSLAIEEKVLQRYTDELDRAVESSTPSILNLMVWHSFTQSVEHFVMALGFWWGSKLVAEGKISFYQFMVSFMGVFFASQAASILFSFANGFTKAKQAANYLFWLSGLQPSIKETEENMNHKPDRTCTSYSMDNVKFSYPLAPSTQVLRGVTLDITRGQFVAFVGASGCGKSTMISLLERFYDPTSGTISIDSTSFPSMNPLEYRKHISIVQQAPALFLGTIRENIAFGSLEEDPSDTQIEEACRQANAWDFISSLPDGLSTQCGPGGSQLSGGQRQRIAIARALIRNPAVILLDEATSALDTESERVVQAALMKAADNDRITIAVAHRLSTIVHADRIFVFSGGMIAEAGSHEELISRNGIYTKMYEAQRLDNSL